MFLIISDTGKGKKKNVDPIRYSREVVETTCTCTAEDEFFDMDWEEFEKEYPEAAKILDDSMARPAIAAAFLDPGAAGASGMGDVLKTCKTVCSG